MVCRETRTKEKALVASQEYEATKLTEAILMECSPEERHLILSHESEYPFLAAMSTTMNDERKCACVRGKEIVGLGLSIDQHRKCHCCLKGLFPQERSEKYCWNCLRLNRRSDVFLKLGCPSDVQIAMHREQHQREIEEWLVRWCSKPWYELGFGRKKLLREEECINKKYGVVSE